MNSVEEVERDRRRGDRRFLSPNRLAPEENIIDLAAYGFGPNHGNASSFSDVLPHDWEFATNTIPS